MVTVYCLLRFKSYTGSRVRTLPLMLVFNWQGVSPVLRVIPPMLLPGWISWLKVTVILPTSPTSLSLSTGEVLATRSPKVVKLKVLPTLSIVPPLALTAPGGSLTIYRVLGMRFSIGSMTRVSPLLLMVTATLFSPLNSVMSADLGPDCTAMLNLQLMLVVIGASISPAAGKVDSNCSGE